MRTAVLLVSLLVCNSCLKEEALKKKFVTYEAPDLQDGWSISSPEQEKIDAGALSSIYREFHDQEELWQVRSLLVFRNAKLVAESYTKNDEDRIKPKAIWSATKQVMGLLTGLALEHGIIRSVQDPISDYLPEVSSHTDKKNIRIEDLLTMRSGIAYSNDGLKGQTSAILRQKPERISDFILSLPMASSPGTEVAYKDGDPQLLSSVIQAQCGKTTELWARDLLFDKLQIKHLSWDHYKDGITLGGFGILTTPREMAKFGQCVLDSGKWKGNVIVDKNWIREMTTVRIENIYGSQFCYLWWRDAKRELYFMSGHGGQYVFILPSKNMLVVMTAEANTQGEFQFGREAALKWVDRIAAISY